MILSSGVYNYTGTTRLWRMRSQSSLHEPQLKSDRNQHQLRTPSSPFPLQLNPCLQMAVCQLSCWGRCLLACHWTPGVTWQTFRGGCPLLRKREDEGSFCLFSCTGNINLKISWESAQAMRQNHLCSGTCFTREKEEAKAVMWGRSWEGISSWSFRRKRMKKHQSCVSKLAGF